MEYIKEVLVSTDKHCDCPDNGVIVEIFAKRYGKSNGVCGPGHHTPLWIESIAFGCNKCGKAYGLPVFKSLDLQANPEIKRQVEFELSLGYAPLTRRIMMKDLPSIHGTRNGKARDLLLGKTTSKVRAIEFTTKRPKVIPPELKSIAAGTIVYFPPSGESLFLTSPDFVTIQLFSERNSKTFEVHRSCFK